MTYGKTWHEGRTVRHHNLVAATQPPITGPIDRGKGGSNTAGKGKGKPKGVTEPAFWVETTRAAMNTATGNQDITVSGLTYTPKAVRIIFNGAIGDGDASKSERATGSIGACDGTNQWVCGWTSEGINSARATSASHLVYELAGSGTTVTASAAFVSFIPGGVRINVGNAPGGPVLMTVEVYGGTSLSADAGVFNGTTAGGTTTVTTGFQTNLMYVTNPQAVAIPGSSTSGIIVNGTMTFDGTTIRQTYGNHQFTTPSGVRTATGNVGPYIVQRSVPGNGKMSVTAVSSTDVTVTTTDADLSGDGCGYLAFNFGGAAQAWTGIVDSPTATGNADLGSASFTPSFAFLEATRFTASETNQVNGEAFAFSYSSITATAQYCNQYRSTDAFGSGGTTDDFAETSSTALHNEDHRSLNNIDATFGSFVPGAVRLNFTNAPGAALKWPLVLIG